MSPDTDSPSMVRQDIAALRRSAEILREEAALLERRARGQSDRAASMEKRLEARLAAEAGRTIIPCGGCGATRNDQRCMGCLHDFGDEASAWVRKYAAPHPSQEKGGAV